MSRSGLRAPTRANGANGTLFDESPDLGEIADALRRLEGGDFSVRLPYRPGPMGELANAFNGVARRQAAIQHEIGRVAREVGRRGRLDERFTMPDATGAWRGSVDTLNELIDDLVRPTRDIAAIISAVAGGDLSQSMRLDSPHPYRGEFLRLARSVNAMVERLAAITSELSRVAHALGVEGKLGVRASVKGATGSWSELTENVNLLTGNITTRLRNIAQVTTAVANGDLSQKVTVDARGEVGALADTINTMVDQLSAFAAEVTRVAREVGTEGRLGGQAQVPGVSGTWKDLTESVNFMAGNLTDQVRNIAQVTTAVANGDLSQKIT
ncbi:MAG TPA: HAMP domain-containing protein, partial [Acidimicrobiia bacterium]|nr:HAMP domain-containing protein [Acidimicrobiia bacterium]